MKNRTIPKALSLFLVIVMITTLTPLTVLAENITTERNIIESTPSGERFAAGTDIIRAIDNISYGEYVFLTLGDAILIEPPTFSYADGSTERGITINTDGGKAVVFRVTRTDSSITLTSNPRITQGEQGAVYISGSQQLGWGGVLGTRFYYYPDHTIMANLQYPQEPENPLFASINLNDISGHWSEKWVKECVAAKIMQGVGNGLFNPNDTFTRAQFTQTLYNLFGNNSTAPAATAYPDINQNIWYAPAVNWAIQHNLIPISGSSFAPNAPITREDAITGLYNASKMLKLDLPFLRMESYFTDQASISPYATEAVTALNTANVISGKVANGSPNWINTYQYSDYRDDMRDFNLMFDPQGNLTRAEAAKILYLFNEIYVALKDIPIIPTPDK